MAEGDGLRAMVARLERLPLSPSPLGPTCPQCWPGKLISPELAAWHRRWHALQDNWKREMVDQNAEAFEVAARELAEHEGQHSI